jgi:hypothetical protein
VEVQRFGPSDPPRQPPPGHTWHLPIIEVPTDTQLYRTSDVRFPDPAYFGRAPTYRFNAPDSSYGVCYLATSLTDAILETLAISRPDEGTWFVTSAELHRRYVARATTNRPLRFAYLADDGLQLLGIDLRVTGGNDYLLSRSWSGAIHHHAAQVDGIFYPSRHHNRLFSVALFDRARAAIDFSIWGTLGERDPRDLWLATTRFLRRFGVQIVVEPSG